MPLIGLCDCNNFFVSCERLFRPDLKNRPVVVLSSNDGVVISRSNEAKALGIPMGEPFFKIEGIVKAYGVNVFSTNFPLYDDISNRVHAIVRSRTPETEDYSVDESFFSLDIAALSSPEAYARDLAATILRWVGIPVSIGLAPTKTLAKLAADHAKKHAETGGVHRIAPGPELDAMLGRTPVGDVWGIGRRHADFLRRCTVDTARKLRDKPDEWLRRHLTIRGLQTGWELRGVSCVPIRTADPPQKSIQVSRSFGAPTTMIDPIREAVTTFASRGAEKLRAQGMRAGVLNVSITTSRFRPPVTCPVGRKTFEAPTSYTPTLVKAALSVLDEIFVPGEWYVKAGIALSEFSDEGRRQLFLPGASTAPEEDERRARCMEAVDRINRILGQDAIRPAAMPPRGGESGWAPRRDYGAH
jgi:DNA polymerase V